MLVRFSLARRTSTNLLTGAALRSVISGPCTTPGRWIGFREDRPAAGLCFGSLGTDTAGSVRIPACYCGIVGLKPTYGRVSNRGVVPLSWTLDHVGPLCKTVEDAALLLTVIAGFDPSDPTSADLPVPDYTRALTTRSGL